MSYTTHADVLFDPEKPVLGATHQETRDNLIAVAEGDISGDGPLRVESAALKLGILTPGNTVSTTNGVFAGLVGTLQLEIVPEISSGTDGDVAIDYRTSTDGGTTPTGWSELITADYEVGGSDADVIRAINVTFPANTNWVEMREDITGSGYDTVTTTSAVMVYGEAG